MNKKLTQNVNISDIVIEPDLYPRSQTNWLTIYKYSQAMKTDAVFPPLDLAILNKRLILVDGRHRLEAYRKQGVETVKANVHVGWDRKKIYIEAVKRNNNHGLALSPYELRIVANRLLEMRVSKQEISNLIHVPLGELQGFAMKNMVNVLTNKPVSESSEESAKLIQMVVKSSLKNLGGTSVSSQEASNIFDTQKILSMRNQSPMIEQLINLIENKYLDLNDKKIIELLITLRDLLNEMKL